MYLDCPISTYVRTQRKQRPLLRFLNTYAPVTQVNEIMPRSDLISEKKTCVLTQPLCAVRASSSSEDVCSDLGGSFDPPSSA